MHSALFLEDHYLHRTETVNWIELYRTQTRNVISRYFDGMSYSFMACVNGRPDGVCNLDHRNNVIKYMTRLAEDPLTSGPREPDFKS